MALYITFVETVDSYGDPVQFTVRTSTTSKQTAINRLDKYQKGYVQEYNSKKIVFSKGYKDYERAIKAVA